ncbi:MAG: GNAT family N-acetyltransferase [Verrucomicrobiales bacterium]|nr:GNAT family N-acetyltransferase [Verrucomicrobiales bacterium]
MSSPYPGHLSKTVTLNNGVDVVLRPIRAEDAGIEQEFVRHLSDESRYFRFMHALKELSPGMLTRLTEIDYDREMAFIATRNEDGHEIEIGVARYIIEGESGNCEFAVVVDDEWQGQGVATALMQTLMEVAKARGLTKMTGEVLSGNKQMLSLMERLEFTVMKHPEDSSLRLVHRPL